jgi:general secretion pathway protein D
MRRLPLSLYLAAGLLVSGPTAWAVQPSQPQSQSADNQVTLNFADTDIPAVLRALSLYTHRNFVVDPRVKGKITLVSEHPVSRGEALSMLSGALRMQGYAMVEVGKTTRVVPEADAKLQGSPVLENKSISVPATGSYSKSDEVATTEERKQSLEAFMNGMPGSEIVTRVFPLKYENANNLIPVLRPLVPPNNTINAYPGNNTLVITDYADNLDRIAKVIARIDVPTAITTEMVPLKYGIAADIAALATQLLDGQSGGSGGGGDQSQRITVAADPRSNSVVIRSGSPARSKLAHDLVLKLDARQQQAGGNMHVVYLRNAQAAHIAQVLGGLLNGRSQTQSVASANGTGGVGGRGGVGGSGMSNMTPSRSTQSTGMQSTSMSMNSNNYGGLGGGSQGGLGSSQPITRQDPTDGQPISFAADGAVIQADTTTNSLIISAPEPLYRDLRTVIDQLDQRRAQVMVESLIVEVSQDASSQFGIQWMTGGGGLNGSGSTFLGGTNLSGSGIQATGPTTLDALAGGLSLGVIKGTTTVLGNQVINLGVLARALQANNQTNVLSTPNLLTLDNEQASIMVGSTVPFVTGQYITNGSNGSNNPFQTIQREDVGLKLNIRPQISEGGSVKLDIYQEVSAIDEAQSKITGGIVTKKRAIDTSVLSDDGDIIVLGGLLEDNVTLVSNSVPGLGSIPVLGSLFRYNSRERVKTNLMVFLRPYVLRDRQSSADLTLSRYNYMRGAQSNAQPDKHWLLPDMSAPILPPANVPTTSAYDMRAGQLGNTLRREQPPTTQTFAVRQVPSSMQPPTDPSKEPIRAILPVGVGVTSDPSIMYAQEDATTTTLQIAQVDKCDDADPIVKRVGISGLKAYSQTGPGGMSCVVRTQVARDSRTVDTAIELLRELGYRAELVQ